MPFDRRKLHALALTLTSGIVLAAAAASPTYADGGRGGDGFSFGGGSPAAGGAGGSEGANGQSGTRYQQVDADGGGGGGGGGAGGGLGGSGGSAMSYAGGAAGQDGESAGSLSYQGAGGGGGGNGGVHGGSLSGFQSNIGDRVGAAGGAAGNGGTTSGAWSMGGGGGGGGAGGYGLVMTGASSNVSLTGSGSASGGDGGNGGSGGGAHGPFSGRSGNGGSGGDGGVGINFTDANAILSNNRTLSGGNGGTGGAGGVSVFDVAGSGGNGGAGGAGVRFDATGGTFTNTGVVQGGNGGLGGAAGAIAIPGSSGLGGAGGAGVIGAGLFVNNLGSIIGGLAADGTRADAITFTGGANALRLTGASTLTGNIGIIAAGSTVNFDHREDVTVANVITGLGGVILGNNASKLTLTGDNTYTGGTVINSGRVLQIGAGGTTGAILGDVVNGGTLIFDRSDAVTFQGIISGTGAVTKSGGGTLTLTSDHTYSGGTTITAGTLQIGTGGTTGSITGDVANNGTLVFHRSDAVTFDGAISGTGGVTKNGGNTLTLTGANTYAGVTEVMNGTLRQGAAGAFSANSNYLLYGFTTLDIGNMDTTIGGLSGSGRVELGGHLLTVGANNTGSSFAGTIANGDLVKVGSGEFSLDGRISNLASVRVDGGTLFAGSEETASTRFTVNAGARLRGYGTVGATAIHGGTLAPGSGPATMTVQGNLSFTAASSYMVEVTPQESGRVNVHGTAALGGAAVNAVFLPAGQSKRAAPGTDVYVAKQYTILNATGGLDGTFAALVNTDLPSGFKTALSYDAKNVYLDLSLAFGMPGGLNGNAGAVGDALTGFFNRTGGIPLAFGTLDAKGLSQIAGETTTGAQQTSFDAANMFMGMMIDPFTAGRGEGAPGAMPYADEAMAYAGKSSPTDAFASMHRKAPARAPQERWNV